MLERYFDRPNFSGRQRQFVRDRLERYPNLVAIDGMHADYPDLALSDHVHLNRRGAEALSLAVGRILRERLASDPASPRPRWIELPPFIEPPANLPIEDLAQSMDVTRGLKR